MNQKLLRASASTRVLGLLAGVLVCGGLLSYGITEEVPLGNVRGVVLMAENGRPLSHATVILTPSDQSESEFARPRVLTSKSDGSFSVRNVPAGSYTVEVSAKAHSLEQESVVVTEGAPTVLDLELKPHEPYLQLYTSQRVFTPSETAQIEAHGFGPQPTVSVEIIKLDLDGIVKKGGIEGLASTFRHYGNEKAADPHDAGRVVQTVQHPITNRDGEGVFVNYVALPKLDEGFYWVRCSLGGATQDAYVNISKISLVTKTWPGKALCYVTEIDSGKPVSGAKIALGAGEKTTSVGVTGPDGTAEVSLASAERTERPVLLASTGSSAAVVDFYEHGDGERHKGTRMFCYTDRPIYRPGDAIQFKGIIRQLAGTEYAMAKATAVDIEIRDADDSTLQKMHLPVSPHGTFSGGFSTNREAKPGSYKIVVRALGDEDTTYVPIAAYRKPDYTVKVTSGQPFYVIGQRARAVIDCEYYFGGPVPGAKVTATISRAPLYDEGISGEDYADYSDEEGDEEGSYEGGGYSGESVDYVEATTDANGRAVIDFDTKPENDSGIYPTDYVYTIDASVVDAGDKYFNGQGSVNVMRGTFGLSVGTDEYVAKPNQPLELNLETFSHDGNKPLAGKEVRVEVGTEVWRNKVSTFTPIQTMSARTGQDGKAKVAFAPKEPGSLVIRAVARDELGNTIESRAYLYVEGGPASRGGPSSKLSVKLDRKQYSIGDSGKMVVTTNSPGGSALITFEADSILRTMVVPLTDQTTLIPFTVDKKLSPNVEVDVAYVHGKEFSSGSTDLIVDLKPKKINVEIVPDRTDAQPGETVTYTLKTHDGFGKPVPAELSLGVVDESIYAIHEDHTKILEGFYPKRRSRVSTGYSFPEIYLDGGDKGGADIAVRTKFADTAFWQAAIQTNSQGIATVPVKLPDNLTTWRATAVGLTDDTAVGMATAKIRSHKPLMIRLHIPAFFVQKDQQRLAATVTNETGKDADVHVSIDAPGLGLEGDRTQTISVPNGKPVTVEWEMAAPRAGSIPITAKAWINGGASDGVQQTLDIRAHGREVVQHNAGEVSGSERLMFTVRPGAEPSSGRLVLTLSPSIASSLVRSLDDLVGFPYGCVEQTMSRFMPSLLVSQALKKLGIQRPDLEANIPAIAADGLARLAKMQHGDGGWGWWDYDESDPFMTALVLDGLKHSADAGYPANPHMVKRGLDWVRQRLNSQAAKQDRIRDRVYMVYALAQHGDLAGARSEIARLDLTTAQAPELSIGVLAANLLGKDSVQLRDTLLARLLTQAQRGDGTVRWSGQDDYCWGEESTGLALTAIATVRPDDPILPAVVRGLMLSRIGGGWQSTRDTSYVLVGMTKYLGKTKELSKGAHIRVLLNGRQIQELRFAPGDIAGPDGRVEVPIGNFVVGENTVDIQTDPGGTSYFTSDFRQTVVRDELGQVVNGNGLQITRVFRRMEVKRLEDGTMKLLPSEKPVSDAQTGDIISCLITISSDKPREFLMIESPIPSNCRITEREDIGDSGEWGWWWSETVVRDDKAAFFARHLQAGTETLSFTMRAESPGIGHALPATASNMYNPADTAATTEYVLRVNR